MRPRAWIPIRAVRAFPLPEGRRSANLDAAIVGGVLWFTGQDDVLWPARSQNGHDHGISRAPRRRPVIHSGRAGARMGLRPLRAGARYH